MGEVPWTDHKMLICEESMQSELFQKIEEGVRKYKEWEARWEEREPSSGGCFHGIAGNDIFQFRGLSKTLQEMMPLTSFVGIPVDVVWGERILLNNDCADSN